ERGWWNGMNVGKRLVALDLGRPEGRDALLRLVAESDVLVENFSARVMGNLGLDWDTLRAANPDLVYVSLSGFGKSGPYRDYAAYGITLEAMAGICELAGVPGGQPINFASAISDPLGGLTGAAAALCGLTARAA